MAKKMAFAMVFLLAAVIHMGPGELISVFAGGQALAEPESLTPPVPEAILKLIRIGGISHVNSYTSDPPVPRRLCVYDFNDIGDGGINCKDDSSIPELFFHEQAVHVGNTMPVYFNAAVTSKLGFLRRRTARKMPFSMSNLTGILELFHIPQGSQEAIDVESTLSLCEAPPPHTACVDSIEDMMDRAVDLLGTSHIRALASELPIGGVSVQPFTIRAVKPVEGSNFVMCHSEIYPYSVFSCHMTEHISAYVVDMESAYGTGQAVSMVAICHRDTTIWGPRHVAFKILGSARGGSTICHFLPYGHVTFGIAPPHGNVA